MKKNSKLPYSSYAVSLFPDDGVAERIRGICGGLSRATGNGFMVQNDVPPHLTLGIFHAADEELSQMEECFREFALRARDCISNLCLDFCGVDSFLDKVIFLRLQKDAPLCFLNRILHESFLLHFESGDNRNYLPQNWCPHIALGVKLSHDQFEKGMEFLGSISTPDKCRIVSVGLARCNPYTPLFHFSP